MGIASYAARALRHPLDIRYRMGLTNNTILSPLSLYATLLMAQCIFSYSHFGTLQNRNVTTHA